MSNRRWKIDDIKSVVAGENPFIQVGYVGEPEQHHKVGEEWIDVRGVTWKQTSPTTRVKVNKQADSIRELVRPRCKACNMDINLFGDKTDKKFFSKTGLCFSCLTIEEDKLKVTGGYQQYEQTKTLRNELSIAKEFRNKVVESIAYLKKDDAKISFVTSGGQVETWTGPQNAELLKEAEDDLVKIDVHIKELEEKIAEL